jgi:hypothetical protein
MDLEAIWAEHKRFLLGLAAAVVVFFIATRILAAMYVRPAERLEASTENTIAKLRRRPAPSESDLRAQREIGKELDARLSEAERRVAFPVDPDFVLAPGAAFDLVYNDRFREVRDEVMSQAARDGVFVDPSLGMPESTPTDRAEVQRILEALDVIGEVLDRALSNGIDSVPQIRVPSAGRKGFHAARSYLDEIRVNFEMIGDSDAVMGLVEALQTGDRFLTVAEARAEQIDPNKPGRVRIRMDVVGLRIDPEAPASDAGASERARDRRDRDREARRR